MNGHMSTTRENAPAMVPLVTTICAPLREIWGVGRDDWEGPTIRCRTSMDLERQTQLRTFSSTSQGDAKFVRRVLMRVCRPTL